jgi:hypothetical protein
VIELIKDQNEIYKRIWTIGEVVSQFPDRKPNGYCQCTTKCVSKAKDGKCKPFFLNGVKCTGLIGILVDNEKGIFHDAITNLEYPYDTQTMLKVKDNVKPMKELRKRTRITVLGTNGEVYSGITVKAGKKYYIISKSPFEEEVMVFRCNSKGHCSNTRDIWHGSSFEQAKDFLANNQP